jgi:type I restriction enzyme S subunit
MNEGWKIKTLNELGVKLIDCDHKTPKAQEAGVPYIGIPQLNNGHIDFEAKPRLISEEDYVKWTRKANPK